MPVWPALARAACRQQLDAAAFMPALCFDRNLARISSDQSSKLVAALRCEVHANCLPVWPALARAACRQQVAAAFLFALLCTGTWQGSPPTNRASLWLLFGARCMQTVHQVLSGRHSHELLAGNTQAVAFLFDLHRDLAGISSDDQSSKLVAALRGEVHANCLPVWPALARAACRQQAATFLFVVAFLLR